MCQGSLILSYCSYVLDYGGCGVGGVLNCTDYERAQGNGIQLCGNKGWRFKWRGRGGGEGGGGEGRGGGGGGGGGGEEELAFFQSSVCRIHVYTISMCIFDIVHTYQVCCTYSFNQGSSGLPYTT